MTAEWKGRERSGIIPLFSANRRLDCVFLPLIERGEGKLLVDDLDEPRAALFCHDFATVAAGDASLPGARRLLNSAPSFKPVFVPDARWDALARKAMRWRAIPITRTKFAEVAPPLDRMKALKGARAPGFSIRRIDSGNIGPLYDALPETGQIMELFWKGRAFPAESFGFCAMTGDGKVAGAAIMGTPAREGRFEIQVETAREHRKRGLATILCACLIEESATRGVVPLYDAADDRSAALAAKLGYTNPERYDLFLPVPTPLFVLRKIGVMRAIKRCIQIFKPDFGTDA